MSNKPRILIPITIQFNVRYILRTGLLAKINEYAQPVILLGWDDEELKMEFENSGAEVFQLFHPSTNQHYDSLRQQINFLHSKRVKSPTLEIDNRRANLERTSSQIFRRKLRQLWLETKYSFSELAQKAIMEEKGSLWKDTNFREAIDFVKSLRIDAVFCLTPYLQNEEFVLRAAEALGIPMSTAILSFDNLTTRGWIPVLFSNYFLWNKYNESELRRIYPEANDRPVTIVGAPQFDFYWDKSFLWDELSWKKKLSIPAGRPIILFGGSPPIITPLEPYWVLQISEAIENGKIPDKPIIIARPHPLDKVERWFSIVKNANNVIVDTPWKTGNSPGTTNIKRENIEKLASTLNYSQVHINTSSTMTIDGSIFDRPQIGPAYDDRPGSKFDRASKELYLREHYLPITNSGGLDIAYSFAEMIKAINSAMSMPDKMKIGRERIVVDICSFNDGKATERVNNSLYSFVQSI